MKKLFVLKVKDKDGNIEELNYTQNFEMAVKWKNEEEQKSNEEFFIVEQTYKYYCNKCKKFFNEPKEEFDNGYWNICSICGSHHIEEKIYMEETL